MVWRGSNTIEDRIIAAVLAYILPCLEVYGYGSFIFSAVPLLRWLFLPIVPLIPIYSFNLGGLPIVQFAVFFGLYLGVARNSQFRHFLRFHIMQTLLITIFISLYSYVMQLLGYPVAVLQEPLSNSISLIWFFSILGSVLFLGVLAASIYTIVQVLRGLYAEIPLISDAAYMQVR